MPDKKVIIEVDGDGKVRGRHTMGPNRGDISNLGEPNTENIIVDIDKAPPLAKKSKDTIEELYYDRDEKKFYYQARKRRQGEYNEIEALESRIEKIEKEIEEMKNG